MPMTLDQLEQYEYFKSLGHSEEKILKAMTGDTSGTADTAKTKGSATDKTAAPGSKSGVRAASFVQKYLPSEMDAQGEADLAEWQRLHKAGKAGHWANWLEDKYKKQTGKEGSNAIVRAYRDFVLDPMDTENPVELSGKDNIPYNPIITVGRLLGHGMEAISEGTNKERKLNRYRQIRAPKADVKFGETVQAIKNNPGMILRGAVDALTDPENLPENVATWGLGSLAKAGAGAYLTGKGFAMTEAAAKAAQLAGKTGLKTSSAARAIPYAAGSTVSAGTGGLAGAFQSGEFNMDDALAGAATGLVMGEAPGLALRAGKAAKMKFGKPAARVADITPNEVRFDEAGGTNYADYWDPKEIEKKAESGYKFNPAEIQEVEAVAAKNPDLKAKLDQIKEEYAPKIDAWLKGGSNADIVMSQPYNKLFKEMHGAKVADVQAKADAATGPKPEKKMTQAQVDDLKAKYPGPELASEDPMTIIANMGGPKAASVLHRKILKAKEQGFDVHVDERLSDLESLAGVMKSRSEMAASATKTIAEKQKKLDDPKTLKAERVRLQREIDDLKVAQTESLKAQEEFTQAMADADLSTKVYGHSFASDFEDRLLKMTPDELSRTMELARRGDLPEAEAALADAFAGYDTEYNAIQGIMQGSGTPATKNAAVRTILETISAKKKAEADLKARGAAMTAKDKRDNTAATFAEADAATVAEGNAEKQAMKVAELDMNEGEHAAQVSKNLNAQQELQAKLEQAGQRWITNPTTTADEVKSHFSEKIQENPALAQEIGVDPDDLLLMEHGTKAQKAAAKKRIDMATTGAAEEAKKTGKIPRGFM